MAGHAVNDLRLQYPDAEITWVVEDRCAGIVASPKLVHRRLDLPRTAWRIKGDFKTLFAQYRWLTGLRQYHFDYGFDFQGHSKTGWCLRLSGAKNRLSIGGTDPVARRLNPIYQSPGFEDRHAVERFDELIDSVYPLHNFHADYLPGEPAKRNPKLVTICVGAGHPAKVIPATTLTEVGSKLMEKGLEVVYLGGAGDSINVPAGSTDLTGKTTIEESVHWIRKSAIHIAGDTGTSHMSAAVGTPLVTIWGNMPIERFRPYTDNVTILNRNGIPADVGSQEIYDAALERLR